MILAPLGLRLSKAKFTTDRLECPKPVRLRRDDGRYFCAPCARRRCVVCGPTVWIDRLSRQFFDGFKVEGVPLSAYRRVTLTAPGFGSVNAEQRQRAWNLDAPRYRQRFFQLLRRRYEDSPDRVAPIEYWWVAELQERGAIHYHVVIRGLRWMSIGVLNEIGPQSGFGNAHLDARRAGGIDARSTWLYYSKYVTDEVLLWDRRARVSGCSAGWAPRYRRRQSKSSHNWSRVSDQVWWYEVGRSEAVALMGGAGESASGDSQPLALDRAPF